MLEYFTADFFFRSYKNYYFFSCPQVAGVLQTTLKPKRSCNVFNIQDSWQIIAASNVCNNSASVQNKYCLWSFISYQIFLSTHYMNKQVLILICLKNKYLYNQNLQRMGTFLKQFLQQLLKSVCKARPLIGKNPNPSKGNDKCVYHLP